MISQDPSSGKASKGSTITLTVVASPTAVPVPTLTGQPSSQAAALLSQANLTLGSQSTACSSSYGKGIIVSSNPGAGQTVAPQSAVSITVSSGPCTIYVPSPNGATVQAYESTLSGLGLVASGGANCSNMAATVTAVSPSPGSQVQSGSTVVMTCMAPTTTTAAG